MKKLYIIQKYVVASSISEAIRKEKMVRPDDIYLDMDWRKAHAPDTSNRSKQIGFNGK